MVIFMSVMFAIMKEANCKLVISTLKAKSGQPLDLLFITDPTLHAVCIPEPINQEEQYNLSLLAHEVCRKAKFKTYSDLTLIHKSAVGFIEPLKTNIVSCDQHQNFSTSCDITSTDNNKVPPDSFSEELECQYLIQMTCSSCHFHYKMQLNSSITLSSPLYPVLQPDLICEYDFFVEDGDDADMELVVNDISIPGHEYSSGHNNHCLESLLTVQAGEDSHHMREIATICGEKKIYKHRGSTISAPGVSRLQLFFVSGSDSFIAGGGFRGFNITLTAKEASNLMKRGILALYILIGLFFFLVFSVVFVVIRKKKEARRPRRTRPRVTWHGSVPRAGQSLHQERTLNLNAELQSEITNSSNIVIELDSNKVSNENNYNDELTVQYSVPIARSRRRSLPSPPSEDPNLSVRVTVNNRSLDRTASLGFKIYESLTSVSSDNFPNAPERPEWTLAVPEMGFTGTSPLYLMMPESYPATRPTENNKDGKILGEASKDNDKTLKSTQSSVSSSANNKPQKNSLMDTAKKICRKLSGSIPKRESKQQLFYLSESDESDDDVFC